jgi:hypothetical protein
VWTRDPWPWRAVRGTLGSAARRREGAHVFLIESYDPFRDWRGTLENVRDLIGPS